MNHQLMQKERKKRQARGGERERERKESARNAEQNKWRAEAGQSWLHLSPQLFMELIAQGNGEMGNG